MAHTESLNCLSRAGNKLLLITMQFSYVEQSPISNADADSDNQVKHKTEYNLIQFN